MKTKTNFLAAGIFLAALLNSFGQPVITADPQSRTNVVGTDATFTVVATGIEPLAYQWRFSTTDLAGKTNDTLIVTNVQPANVGGYTVVVTNVDGAVTSVVATLTVLVPPTITKQPTNQSASLGAKATFSALAAGTSPLYFQWRLNETNLPGKTSTSLVFTKVQLTNAGDYTVVVTNAGGSVISQVAHLAVDATFTKITSGNIVTDIGNSFAPAWGDFNGDGFVDLFVGTGDVPSAAGNKNLLYRNNGDGTFTKVTNGSIVTDITLSVGAAWGDFDNDGDLDLVAANYGYQKNSFYRNDGGGVFTRFNNGVFTKAQDVSHGAVWGDFDNDGRLDLFVTNFKQDMEVPNPNVLYRNLGDETFSAIPFATKTINSGYSTSAVWGDYDNDGDLDLFVSNGGWFQVQSNELHRNDGHGVYTRLTNSVVAGVGGFSESGAWGDYDNDGFLDLFVANTLAGNNFLYHNQGDGTFSKVTNSIVTLDGGDSIGCAWADYDNDGWLDLFVANGEFASRNNFLYHNNGNSNNWINFKLVGTVSNRAAIGAKVRVKATIGGKTFWQLREVSGGSGFGSQNELRANFGLGDASNVDLVQIEWPSGIVQTLTDVPAKQFLEVVEHQSPGAVTTPPSFTSVSRSTNGVVDLSVTGDIGLRYLFEASTNLVQTNWTWLGVRTNLTGTIQFTDPRSTNFTKRFYRVSIP